MKWDQGIRAIEHQFKVDDVVYWRRTAGKKSDSMWIGPGVLVDSKFDTAFIEIMSGHQGHAS